MKKYAPSASRNESLARYKQLEESSQENRGDEDEEDENDLEAIEKRPAKFQRIAFLFIISTRSHYRQIIRLLKTLYDKSHFYYFHIDSESAYLRKRMSELEKYVQTRNINNIRLTKWSLKPFWSSHVLLELHLRAMKDLVDWKKEGEWDWDYVHISSETDYPLK